MSDFLQRKALTPAILCVLLGCVEPPTQGTPPTPPQPDMRPSTRDASADLRSAPPADMGSGTEDMREPPEEMGARDMEAGDMKTTPMMCPSECEEGFICEEGVCTWSGMLPIQVRFASSSPQTLLPQATTQRNRDDGPAITLGEVRSVSDDVAHASCPPGMLMTGALIGFGPDSSGDFELLRQFNPICHTIGFTQGHASQSASWRGSPQMRAGFVFSPVAHTQILECGPGQIIAGLEARGFNYTFHAMEMRLHCTSPRLDAAGQLITGPSSTTQRWLNEGECSTSLSAVEDIFDAPACRSLGGACPQGAPAPLDLHVSVTENGQQRRPDAWQFGCHELTLE